MTADQKFLKQNNIEPCDIRQSNWQDWRNQEIEELRDVMMRQGELITVQGSDLKRWKACAILGWLFAAMLFSIPIIERSGQ